MSTAQDGGARPAERTDTERLQVEAMVSEGGMMPGPVAIPPDAEEDEDFEAAPQSAKRRLRGRSSNGRRSVGALASNLLSATAEKIGKRHLDRLSIARDGGATKLSTVPDRMHRVANQTRLILELIDDFRAGIYRDVPWRTIALLAGAALYAVNPGDVIPDVIPGLGALDDLAVITVAVRWARKDLLKYCKFKGHPLNEYFTL